MEMEIEVIRSSRKTLSAQIRDGRVIVRAPLRATDESIRLFLGKHKKWLDAHLEKARDVRRLTPEEKRALAEEALRVIPGRVAHYAPLVGVTYGRITIRDQRSRWGSCSSKGNLNFNCLLMLAPPEVLDSVVVHELCHRKELNHSDRFWAEVYRVYPDYPACRKWLNDNGPRLMAMLGA